MTFVINYIVKTHMCATKFAVNMYIFDLTTRNTNREIIRISTLFAAHGYPITKLSAITFLHYSRFSATSGEHPS